VGGGLQQKKHDAKQGTINSKAGGIIKKTDASCETQENKQEFQGISGDPPPSRVNQKGLQFHQRSTNLDKKGARYNQKKRGLRG